MGTQILQTKGQKNQNYNGRIMDDHSPKTNIIRLIKNQRLSINDDESV